MALTSTQQNKIMQLLGYGGKILQVGSVIYNQILNDRLTDLPTDTENQTILFLASVAVLEAQMLQAPARLAASSVDDLKMNLAELEMLRSERRRIAKEMAAHLDIPYQGGGGSNVTVRC